MAHKPREQDQIFDVHNGRPSYEAAPGILVLFKIYHVGYWLLKDETDIQTRLNHQQKSTQLVQNSSINPHYKKQTWQCHIAHKETYTVATANTYKRVRM